MSLIIELDFYNVDIAKIVTGWFFEKKAGFPDCNIFIMENLRSMEKQIIKNYPYI